jgi:hypothetical protein
VELQIDETRAAGKRVDIGRIVLTLRGEEVADYTLRTIPADLWRGVKSRAASEGRTIRDVLIERLEGYVGRGK